MSDGNLVQLNGQQFYSDMVLVSATPWFLVQGHCDPFYPIELSVEMARAIPNSSLWIIPNSGHGPVMGERWPEFLAAASAFLRH